MFESLLNNSALKILFSIFSVVFATLTKPTKNKCMWFAAAIMVLNSCRSVRFMFGHFIERFARFKLSGMYATFKSSKINIDNLSQAIIRLALKIVDTDCPFPIRAVIDDTMIEKMGITFEEIKKLFDHAKHNGTNYLTGHCFVCLVLLVPVKILNSYKYIRIPVTYRMWKPNDDKTKIQMGVELFRLLFSIVDKKHTICCMFDSWYATKEILSLLDEFKNVEAQFSARINTCMYELPPVTSEKKQRGAPRKYGKRVYPKEDFVLEDVPDTDYSAGSKQVITRILGSKRVVTAVVTYNKTSQTYRLFICTNAKKCHVFPDMVSNKTAKAMVKNPKLNVVAGCFLRWNIETNFQEHKSFWGLRDYMLRSVSGIESLLNLQLVVYAVLAMLPWLTKEFAYLADLSVQERRFEVGRLIDRDLFLGSLAQKFKLKNNHETAQELQKIAQEAFIYNDTGS